MRSHDAVRAGDRDAASARPLDVAPLLGTWINTESRWQWIRRLEVRDDGGDLTVRMTGGNEPSPQRWGPRPVEAVYAASIHGGDAVAFRASFDHGEMRSEVQATLNQGLMVLVAFTDATDDGTSRVTREFFAREGGAA